MKILSRWCGLALLLFAAFGLLAYVPVSASDGAVQETTITVQATGDARVSPNMAYIWLGVHTENANAGVALRESNEAVQKVLAVLKDYAPPEFTKTSEFNMYRKERWDEMKQQSIADNFVVRHVFEARLSDLQLIGEVVDKAVEAGANVINGIQYGVSDSKKARSEAYESAIDDAFWKAKVIADAAGFSQIEPIKIEESYYYGPMFAAEGGAPVTDMPRSFMPGQLKISVTLNVQFQVTK